MNILLYVFDALRPDYLGCYGFERDTSPNIDQFAEDSVRFNNAYATTTWTKASAASMMASQYPRTLDMMHESDRMPEIEWSLGRVFSDEGFSTSAVSSNLFFSPEYGFTGFDDFTILQKHDDIIENHPAAKPISALDDAVSEKLNREKLIVPHSEYLNEELISRLDRKKDQLHVAWSVDTHGPYYLRGNKSHFGNDQDDFLFENDIGYRNQQKAKSLYCDMIRYNDRTFGELLKKLRDQGIYEDSLIIVAGDHGESFGDHKTPFKRPIIGHTGPAYEEVIKVPLIIKLPGNHNNGTVREELVQLTDIYPTITDVADIEIGESPIVGKSLFPPERCADDRIAVAETQITPSSNYSAAVRKGRYKLLIQNRNTKWELNPKRFIKSMYAAIAPESKQLFYLEVDPHETRDLSGVHSEVVEELESLYDEFIERADKQSAEFIEQPQNSVSEDTRAHLKAMGYFNE